MAQHPDVLILGGGVIGLTTAYFLARERLRVEVLDKGDLGQESSWAGAGILSPAPEPARARTPHDRLLSLSIPQFPRFSAELRDLTGVDNGFRVCGGLDIGLPGGTSHEDYWAQSGIRRERLDAAGLRAREPALTVPETAVYYFPDTGQVRNPRHVKALVAACGRLGVRLRPCCGVLGIDRRGSTVAAAHTTDGPLTATKYLVAGGAWTDQLLHPLGQSLGVRPVRGQIALLNTGAPLLSHVVEVGKRYLVPRPDGRVLVGSTEEDAGFDKHPTAAAVAELLRFAQGLAPRLGAAHLERCWAGLRPGSPDGLPFLGRVPGLDNLFVAAGHYRSGIQLSPGTAQVLTELLLDRPPSVPMDAFRVGRQ